MPDPVAAGTKRKKPPTFQHLPEYRAKTLKKSWVQKTKIKSKWKAEKRREGLDSAAKLDLPVYEDEDRDERHNSPRHTSDVDSSGEDQGASPSTAKPRKPQASVIHPSRAHIHPDLPVKKLQSEKDTGDPRPMKKQKSSKDDEASEPVSLRELTRQAYSKESLHTFKSDPLKKHRSHGDRNGRGGAMARGRGRSDERPTTGFRLIRYATEQLILGERSRTVTEWVLGLFCGFYRDANKPEVTIEREWLEFLHYKNSIDMLVHGMTVKSTEKKLSRLIASERQLLAWLKVLKKQGCR